MKVRLATLALSVLFAWGAVYPVPKQPTPLPAHRVPCSQFALYCPQPAHRTIGWYA